MSIYTGQRIPLESYFVDDDGVAVDVSTATIRYDYWLPGNKTNVPDGNVSGTAELDPVNYATGSIPASLNTVKGTWIIQGNATIGTDEWPEISSKFKVLDRGKT